MAAVSFKHKIVLLGDGAVGKTSLVRRFVVDQFDDRYIATIGAKVMKKDVRVSSGALECDVALIIWDVLGQKGFHGVQAKAFDQSRGVVFVTDLSRPETAQSIKDYWMPRVKDTIGSVPLVLFGNKLDLAENKNAAEVVLAGLAKDLGCKYFLTSAKTGENVETGFSSFAKTLVEAGEIMGADRVPREADAKAATIEAVADRIMTDFCEGFGGVEAGTPILNEQFRRAGFDINRPTKERLLEVIRLLATVEASFKSEKDAEESRARRAKWVEDLKGSG